MSSKQINFFHLEVDLIEIDVFIKKNNIIFIRQPLTDINSIKYNNENISLKSKDEFDKVFLTNHEFINEIKYRFSEKMNYYVIDDLRSNAIEFTRSSLRNNKLSQGRLYFNKNYYSEFDTLTNKSIEFIMWSEQIFKNFKKEFLIKNNNILHTKKSLDWANQNHATADISGLTLSVS